MLEQLRELGVTIAVDDFGTGYSSLAHLRRLPVDRLKIDRSFVAELSEGHPEITGAIVALAAGLGLDSVAEGVEDVEQMPRTGGAGCHPPAGVRHRPPDDRAGRDRLVRRACPVSAPLVDDVDRRADLAEAVDERPAPRRHLRRPRGAASIDTMAAQRPVAAQIVALTHADDAGAKDLSRLLAADAALTGRVLKLANSAYYGLRGRVSSLQFAVTVVGFSTVRSMATVALTSADQLTAARRALDDEHPPGAGLLRPWRPGWATGPPDALCVGLLAQLGAALLHHHDPHGLRRADRRARRGRRPPGRGGGSATGCTRSS